MDDKKLTFAYFDGISVSSTLSVLVSPQYTKENLVYSFQQQAQTAYEGIYTHPFVVGGSMVDSTKRIHVSQSRRRK